MMLLLATEHSWDCDVVCRGRASREAKPCGTFGHYYCARTSVRSVCPQGTNSYTSYIHEWVSSLSSLNIGQATSRPDSHWILYTRSMHACSKLLSLKNIRDDMQKRATKRALLLWSWVWMLGTQSVILFHPYRVTLNYDDHVRPKQKMLIILFSFMVHKNTVPT